MVTLITATGREILCDAVIRATYYAFLTIHTNALSRIEVDTIFDDPAETRTLTVIGPLSDELDEDGNPLMGETVYHGWTVLDTVQRSPMFPAPGELMIWLTRPPEEN